MNLESHIDVQPDQTTSYIVQSMLAFVVYFSTWFYRPKS